MLPFTPSPPSPTVVEVAPPRYGAQPISIESHGYRYVVTGNTLLPPKLIEKVLRAAPTPKAALGKMQDAYHERGYTLVAITGETHGKTTRVSVFQGTITEVKTPEDVGWFFTGLEGRNDVLSHELVEDQVLAGAYAARGGRKIDVNVAPAVNPAGTTITVSDPPIPGYTPVTGTITFGNYGNRYTGGYQLGASAVANLTHGVQLSAYYVRGLPWLEKDSRGSSYQQGGGEISAVTPWGIYGFAAGITHFRLGNVTAPLFPIGDINTYSLHGAQLAYADTSTRVLVTEALNRTTFKETVLDNSFTLLDQRYNWVALGGSYSRSLTVGGQPGSLTATASVDLGVSDPSGTLIDDVPGAPTSHFQYGTVSAAYQQHLPHGFELNLTGMGQWAGNTLPAEQQWTLGGFGNLSAWRPGVAVGDSGYLARAELTAPPLTRFHSKAQFGVFFETGGSRFTTTAPRTATWQTLSDVGLSLRLTLPYDFTATAMAGFPIESGGFTVAGENNVRMSRVDAFFVVQKRF